jgi:hypothetical protein
MRNRCWCTGGAAIARALAIVAVLWITANASAGTGCPGDGDCFVANGTPGCDDAACCAAVCAVDSFCCDVEWDTACADEAAEICGNCGDPGAGNCFVANGTIGCDNADCCAAVCAVDSFCCEVGWDDICADEAAEICGDCGDPAAGSCFEPNGTIGCDNFECCAAVCAVDSFCCDTEWDEVCADEAAEICATCGGAGAGDCGEPNGTPGCNDEACCNFVCSLDPFCCDVEWDQACADEATLLCTACVNGTGSCFQEHETVGCDDPDCCATVCGVDSFCCDTEWDSLCAEQAAELCGNCGDPKAGSCFEENGTIGCDNAECCAAVCAMDSFCCDTEWDSLCVEAAGEICASCGGAGAGDCFAANSTPGCNDADCCTAVCAVDSFCCDVEWDGVCAEEAAEFCPACGSSGSGSCFAPHANVGCDDPACCAVVCDMDSFCCSVEWDQACADEAAEFCSGGGCPQDCVSSDTFAPPPDGNVDAADLAFLLGDWGVCPGCCADTVTSATFAPPPDGVVDAADLAALLGAWGSPGCQ